MIIMESVGLRSRAIYSETEVLLERPFGCHNSDADLLRREPPIRRPLEDLLLGHVGEAEVNEIPGDHFATIEYLTCIGCVVRMRAAGAVGSHFSLLNPYRRPRADKPVLLGRCDR